jgi:hypothetical protein
LPQLRRGLFVALDLAQHQPPYQLRRRLLAILSQSVELAQLGLVELRPYVIGTELRSLPVLRRQVRFVDQGHAPHLRRQSAFLARNQGFPTEPRKALSLRCATGCYSATQVSPQFPTRGRVSPLTRCVAACSKWRDIRRVQLHSIRRRLRRPTHPHTHRDRIPPRVASPPRRRYVVADAHHRWTRLWASQV